MTKLAPPSIPRSPWQKFYGAVLDRRRRRAKTHAERLPVPVVSLGNLHWGGGGKTPFTAAIAADLHARGLAVAIVSRGYRRTSRGPLVVSLGSGPQVSWSAAGDEPFLLAQSLPGVAVAVGEERVAAARLLLRELAHPPDLFLLDDGFSHVALARDLEILLFPAADPFARGRLAPLGRLREPLAASRHADAVVLTGTATADLSGAGSELAAALAPHGFNGPGFTSATASGPPRTSAGGTLAPGTRVVAFAGIARPENFFRDAERHDLVVAARLAFPDHHDYPDESVARIEASFRRHRAAALLTTAKDALKLEGRLNPAPAVLPILARPEAAFWDWFDERLAALRR
ncbi:MAG: tetraacyldisaccharide 4'-kinase [Thermoanaerobaculia bacterium]